VPAHSVLYCSNDLELILHLLIPKHSFIPQASENPLVSIFSSQPLAVSPALLTHLYSNDFMELCKCVYLLTYLLIISQLSESFKTLTILSGNNTVHALFCSLGVLDPRVGHIGHTFSIYLYPLSFSLTLPQTVLCMS